MKAALRALAIARDGQRGAGGTESHATRYRVHVLREARVWRYWEVPPAWRQALRGSEAPMPLRLLNEEDQALLEGMFDGLGQGERDRLLQEAVRILRARGWRQPELSGEDLEKMMQELVLQRSFGLERIRKYGDRIETREESEAMLAEAISKAGPANTGMIEEGRFEDAAPRRAP